MEIYEAKINDDAVAIKKIRLFTSRYELRPILHG